MNLTDKYDFDEYTDEKGNRVYRVADKNSNECQLESYPQYGEDCVGCSVCGFVADRYVFEEFHSCPNCGRKVV